jgi:quinoprotein glucose dehydrogenase
MSNSRLVQACLWSVAAISFSGHVLTVQARAAAAQTEGQSPTRAEGQPSTQKGDWPYYFADARGTRYSPQDQINASNFNQLEVAWHFKTDNLGGRPEYKLEGTPLEVNGVVYTTAGSRRDVVALSAKTGELRWVYSFDEGERAIASPRQLSGRGVSYWTDGQGDERILYITTGFRLVELNAKTGRPIESFGTHGMIDMKVGAYTGTGQQIDLTKGEIGLHTTPTVVKDVVIVGSAFKEGTQPETHNNTKGIVRAWNVRTGKQLWQFHTIPKKGEFGYDTWLNGSADVNGNTGVWSGITVDADLGLVYLPVEDPTVDQYGGARPGNDLFGDSIVCVDINTGKMKWYFQVAHHPIWDYDLSSPPILADITVDGRKIKAVAVPSKESFLYVFDRVTGKPVWPIIERPVPQGDVPGEWYSPTQPFPTKPPAYARQAITMDDLVDFTPEIHAKALELVKHYKMGPMFLSAVVSKVDGPIDALTIGTLGGGTNWPGAGYDPENDIVFAPAANAGVSPLGLVEPPPGFSDSRYLSGVAGQSFRVNEGPGYGSASDAPKISASQAKLNAILAKQNATETPEASRIGTTVDGLPLVKPPYGLLSAINLNTGDLMWQVPHGDTPDSIRDNPALKGLNIPKTGQQGNVGLVVTKSLVIMGDPLVSTTPEHPRGAMLRAYDKMTGKQVGAVWMPAPQSGSPMTYSVDGKQYIIVAVSGGNYSGDYIAYSLPSGN